MRRAGSSSERPGARRLFKLLAVEPAHRLHRDEVIELLWPEVDLDAGRNRLSIALSSLRHQLEPPGVPAGAVIQADRASVRLNPAVVTTDAAAFQAAITAVQQAESAEERALRLTEAVQLYRGEFLAGYYEDWIQVEQKRLAGRYLQAVRSLASELEQAGTLPAALDYAQRALAADPLREETSWPSK